MWKGVAPVRVTGDRELAFKCRVSINGTTNESHSPLEHPRALASRQKYPACPSGRKNLACSIEVPPKRAHS